MLSVSVILVCYLSFTSITLSSASINQQQNFSGYEQSKRDLSQPVDPSLFNVECPLPLTTLKTGVSNFSTTDRNLYCSNNYINVPCAKKYFYLNFKFDSQIDPIFVISGAERPNGAPFYQAQFTGNPASQLWNFLVTKETNARPGYLNPFKYYNILKTPSTPYALIYDEIQVRTIIANKTAAYLEGSIYLASLFANQKDIYLRVCSKSSTPITITNISLFCKTDDVCSKPQLPSTVKPFTQSNKFANLTCSSKEDKVVLSENFPSITNAKVTSKMIGTFNGCWDHGHAISFKPKTGFFNASFLLDTKTQVGLNIYNQDFCGSTYVTSRVNIATGEWDLGNYLESRNTDTRFVLNKSRMFISLDPSGISLGYDSLAVVTLGYDKFDMDDLLINGKLHIEFLSDSSTANFVDIRVDHFKRTCNPKKTQVNAPDLDVDRVNLPIQTNGYGSAQAMQIVCLNNIFSYNKIVYYNSDVFITLVDSNGLHSPSGVLEIQYGLKSGLNTIKKIPSTLTKRSNTTEGFEKAIIGLCYNNGALDSYVNNVKVATYTVKDFYVKALYVGPLQGYTQIAGGQVFCDNCALGS